MPVRMVVTAGTVADCTPAEELIEGIEAEYLLADRGYDTNGVLAAARARGMAPVIPPKRSRKSPRGYDGVLYQARYMVEHEFCQLKEWRGVVWRRVMPRKRRRTWRFARYAPWRCGPK